jgi:predicted nucleic acid-binding protein
LGQIVVDTSAVLAVILDEPERSKLITLTEGAQLAAPGCIIWEVSNAFSAMLKRKRILIKEALRGVKIFKSIPIQSLEVDMPSVLKFCAHHNMYAYDAFYLDCARRHKAPLLTLDKKLQDIAHKEKIRILEV